MARMLGLQVGAMRGNVNQGISPCPSCGAERRSRRDRRGPIGIRPDDRGWRCHRCDAHGNAVNLAAWVLLGAYKPPDSDWRRLQARCAEAGLCDAPFDPSPHSPFFSARRSPRRCEEHWRVSQRPPAAIRPPVAEVRDLWQACRSVTSDEEVAAWLVARGLEPENCAAWDLVRALPSELSLPGWARFGRPWTQSGHRVIIPMYGPQGALETLHARALAPRDPKGRDKAASPKGAQVAGTIMADRRGLQLLASDDTLAPTLSTYKTHTLVHPATLIIAEGVPDFLTWATHYHAEPDAPAVFGIIAGSWSDAIAERIPDGTRVMVRAHDDKAGHKYAQRIADTLRDRCRVFCRAVKDGT